MSGGAIDRRAALALGGGAMLAAGSSAAAQAAPARASCGILLFDPRSAEARLLAGRAYGQQLIALSGDPVRLWRDRLLAASGPIGGITCWSDYILLRGLAAEQGLRIRHEEHIAVPGKSMLVHWLAA